MARPRHRQAYREAAGVTARRSAAADSVSASSSTSYDDCGTCGAAIDRVRRRLDFRRGTAELDACSADPRHDIGRDPCVMRLTYDEPRPEPPSYYDPRLGRRVPHKRR
jgi:hypothetical protein